MACNAANNVAISPVNILWQIEASHQITTVADVAGSLDGKYFNLMSTHYVWFDTGVSVDPAPAGKTGLQVIITSGDSAAIIAGLMSTAIDGDAGFSSSVSGAEVTAKAAAIGLQDDSADVDAGISVDICRRGKDLDLGLLEGDIELSASPANFIVKAHQTGVTPLAALYQGMETAEISTTMLETTSSKLEDIYGFYGGEYNPGTKTFGVGTSKQGQNLLVDSARLVLRPVNAVDNITDTVLMLAVPVPGSLLFSGENPKTLSVTWQGFADTSYASNITNIITFGDAFQ